MRKLKGFQLPNSIKMDENSDDFHGIFELSPLEKGMGITIANSLRRVLLSNIHGTGIKYIRIDGIQHEYSTIPNVREDTMEIVLNMKEVVFKLQNANEATIYLDVAGPKKVTAADFEKNDNVVIVNPDAHIATISEDGHLKLEVNLVIGMGYVMVEPEDHSNYPLGTILVDYPFSPIKKCSYKVEQTRVKQRTDREKVIMDITTNGSISPKKALNYASKIMKKHYDIMFADDDEFDIEPEEERNEEFEKIRKLLMMNVNEMELSVRASNCLKDNNIKILADLLVKTEAEMLKFRNFGKKSLNELKDKVNELGLSFGMDVSKYLNANNKEEDDIFYIKGNTSNTADSED